MNYRVFLILSSLLLANKAEAPLPVLSKEEALEEKLKINQRLNERDAQKAKEEQQKIRNQQRYGR